jgi:preprotein translocase subunit SecE
VQLKCDKISLPYFSLGEFINTCKNKSKMNFIQYIKDSFDELNNHMTWISKEDAQKTTVTVAVFTILFALAVAGIDYVFQTGLDNFFGMFKSN